MKALLIISFVTCLASCGGSGPDGTTTSTTATTTTTTTTSEFKAEEELASGFVFKSVATSIGTTLAAPTVAGITLKSQRRIARTVFEYEFTVQIATGSTPLNSVILTLNSVGQGSQIVDGSVTTGGVTANTNITPTDTILVNHDRTKPFDPSALIWSISSVPVSNPQPALAGTDANGDGVRDDVEVFIKTSTLIPQQARSALTKLASGMQDAMLAKSKSEALAATKKRMDSAICLTGIVSSGDVSKLMGEVASRQFDTPDRIAAEINYRQLIGGEAFWPDFSKPSQSFCK